MLARTVSLMILAGFVGATAHAATVDGYCYLEGKTNHCGTKVELDGAALHLPQHTDPAGYFGPFVLVAPGWHTFTYTHPGYEPETVVWHVPALGGTLPPVTLETKALCAPPSWQHYPYTIPGTTITFPYDEGKHDPTSTYPIEWWYVNFHLTDETGEEYAGIVSFFKPPVGVTPCMVLFSIINLESGLMYADAKYPLICDANDQWLDLAWGAPPVDRWFNRQCEADLIPFEYHMSVSWADEGVNWLELDMAALKAPMAIGGDGFVEFGDVGWSYYYSHPRVDILGTLHLQGFPALGRDVQGYAWIDHQWADFPTQDVTWEWLSIQLDDLRDILVADVWINEVQENFSGGLNYYDENCSQEVLHDYNITRTRCWRDPVHDLTYATEWRVREPSRQIDLIVTADYEHQVMETTGDIIGANFWEGACTVSGTIEGQPVQGTAFGELTYSWDGLPEACCAGDGACWYVPPDLCIAQGGTPQGAGTDCETTECPQACCLPNGDCQFLLTSACTAQDGNPQGPGVYCEPEQACCLGEGECQMLAPVCCRDQGGIPMGYGSDCDPNPCRCACCPDSPFGNGTIDHVVHAGTTLILIGDTEYHNLTVEAGGSVSTGGHTLRVCNVLLNEGTIRAPHSGGSGGDGGNGGKGANPVHAPSDPTGCGRAYDHCTPGQPGENGSGRGGDGGGGGGGGGGAENLGRDADGGNGAAGGDGGAGGGDLLLYAFRLNNNGGVIHADGQDGSDGEDAPEGDSTDPNGYENCGAEYYDWPAIPVHDVEGGGGGGGAGGDGGNGGIVEIHYGILVSSGTTRAEGGSGGDGGSGGSSGGCDEHIDLAGSHQNGCAGANGGGHGGRGEHRVGYCAEDGTDGADGSPGAPGTVIISLVEMDDCNDNGCPDECDIANCDGSPWCNNCNGNGIPDGCELDGCDGSQWCDDCNGNGILDSCDIADCLPGDPDCDDCNGNGVPDWCDIHSGASQDRNDNGIPDECELCPGDMDCDGDVDFDDIDPFVRAIGGEEGYLAVYPDCFWLNGDCNGDGDVTFDDIDCFVSLIGTVCDG